MKRTKGFLLLVMMLLGLFCLGGPSWAEAACPEGEPQQSYTGSLLITAKEGDADSQSGVNPLATFEGDGGTVKLDHIGSGILRWQVLPDKIANDPFSFAGTIYLYKVVSGKQNTSIAIRQTGLELHSPAFWGRLIHMYEREPMWCVGLELLQARYGLRSCAPMSK